MTAPVSDSPLNDLQKALIDRLRGDSQLATLLGAAGKVVDYAPENLPYPYVRVGERLSIPDNDLTSYGRNVTETIHVWTKARGNLTGQTIADRIIALLDHRVAELNALLTTAGSAHRAVSIRHEFDQALTDPDPEIRHHVLRFRVVTAQQA